MATTYPLTTVEKIRKYRLLQGDPLEDKPEIENLYEILIDSYTTLFENYCARKFVSRSYTEIYDGDSDNFIIVDNIPIISASGVSIWDDTDSEPTWSTDTLVASGTYYVDNKGESITLRTGYFSNGIGNIKISYCAGYDTVPADIEYACISEVIRAVKRRNTMDVITSAATDKSTTYIFDFFLPQTKAILNQYKRKRIGTA